MQEPLFWNPLPDAAAYLTHKTGRAMDTRALLDIVAGMGKQGEPTPTIIKALLPRDAKFAKVAMPGHRELTEVDSILGRYLTNLYGPLPMGLSYIGETYARAEPLHVNHVVDLLMYGHIEISLISHGCEKGAHQTVWLMPWGTSHVATVDTCGINRDDLLALGENLLAQREPPASDAVALAPVASDEKNRTSSGTNADQASLFDAVGYNALEKMFATGNEGWKRFAERASTNGLKAARQSRGKFNPLMAGLWWLDKHNPPGWTIERLYRVLANNLPPRSSDSRHLLIGDYD